MKLTALERRALGLASHEQQPLSVELRIDGVRVLVDVDDLALVSDPGWCISPHGYASRCERDPVAGKTRTIWMHRHILGLQPGDGLQVDHINRDKLDNRRANLRVVTHAENLQNIAGGYGRAGIRGVSWEARRNLWRGRVEVNGREYSKYFGTVEEAAAWSSAKRAELMPYSDDARRSAA